MSRGGGRVGQRPEHPAGQHDVKTLVRQIGRQLRRHDVALHEAHIQLAGGGLLPGFAQHVLALVQAGYGVAHFGQQHAGKARAAAQIQHARGRRGQIGAELFFPELVVALGAYALGMGLVVFGHAQGRVPVGIDALAGGGGIHGGVLCKRAGAGSCALQGMAYCFIASMMACALRSKMAIRSMLLAGGKL